MASMGSFPFVVDTVVDSSVLLHSKNNRRPKLAYLSNSRPRRVLDLVEANGCAFGGVRVRGEDSNRLAFGGGVVQKWMMNHRVMVRGQASMEGESSSQSEDALQATIEKSKEVLARQKELLGQIAESRKLVSSIKRSLVETETDNLPLDSKDVSVSNSASIGNDESNGVYNHDTLTVDRLDQTLASPTSKDFIEDSIENGKKLPQNGTALAADSATYSRTATSKKLQPGIDTSSTKNWLELPFQSQLEESSKVRVQPNVPSSLPKPTAFSYLNNEKQEKSGRSYVHPTSIKAEEPSDVNTKPPPLAGANVMNVILVAAECAPWSKTGGLGDVAGALPKALARRGHRVMVIAPRYGNYAEPQDTGVRKRYKVDGQDMEVNYFHAYVDGVDFVFIDSPILRNIEKNIYGGNRVDILKRMVLFCKAAIEVPWYVPCGGVCYGDGNLVFVANDWHTALLPVYLKAYYRDHGIMKYTRSVLVIHNIAHQGRGPVDDFTYVDLPSHYKDLFRLHDPIGGEHLNIFGAGLKTADRVVTVSHGYSWELKTSEGGWGLHGIINENDWKLRGIVNGIDTKDWSPELDTHLQSDGYTNYSLDTLQTGKSQCKAALQKELGLPVRADVPLIGFIGRLDHQKGVDLIVEAVPWMSEQDVQLVMLGTGRPDLEEMLRQMESHYKDKIRGWVGFSVKTAHRITAGADILLMPSRFEPCGLNQLYAMRYGTIPVVHAVGGLRDTVQPFDPYNESGLGWTFGSADTNQLIHALGNCLFTYREYKESWNGLQRRGMTQDLSWDNAAQIYEEVFVAAKYQW
ncbi:hypothetical protein Leryth_026298 [Lithospermum erythrorhizon]|nr:hypothetical protein Leryth_026298 [Lithospermum erythrorhizon]